MAWDRTPYISKPKKNSKNSAFFVYYYRLNQSTGKLNRHRVRCTNLSDAKVVRDRLSVQYSREGINSFLSDKERYEYRAARAQLTEKYSSEELPRIVSDWVASQPKPDEWTFKQFVQAYLDSNKFSDKRPVTQQNEKPFYKRLMKAIPDKFISQITYNDLFDYLENRQTVDGISPRSRNNEMRRIKSLFSWGCRNERRDNRLSENVALELVKRKEPTHKKPCLEVNQVKGIFKAAEESDPALIPALALCYFAGIRPDQEIKRVARTPRNIRIAEKLIVLTSDQTKTEEARRIENLPDNLFQWLSIGAEGQNSPKIDVRNWSKRKRRVHIKAGVITTAGVLPNSISRHTFASYACQFKGIPDSELRKIMGHARDEMTKRYTSMVILQNDAEEYFSICPSKEKPKLLKPQMKPRLDEQHLEEIVKHIICCRTNSWIGKQFGVTEAAIRKYRDRFKITKADIILAWERWNEIDQGILKRYDISEADFYNYKEKNPFTPRDIRQKRYKEVVEEVFGEDTTSEEA